MNKRVFALCAWVFCVSSLAGPVFGRDMRVVFFNPGGEADIGVWGYAARFMRAAAQSLDIRLEILHANRDHLMMISQADAVSRREVLPDYAILVNEKQCAPAMMEFFREKPVKIMLMHNDLTAEQRVRYGKERAYFANWIGTVATDERRASLLQMEALARLYPGYLEVAAISGTAFTPVSKSREEGLRQYLSNNQLGRLLQVVHADWSRQDGKFKAAGLLDRYPGLNAFWAANDSMAMGALDAVREAGRDKKVGIVGRGGFPDALDSIRAGGLKATVGGTLTTGAWVLVLLYDYHHGLDFADAMGVNIMPDHLATIDTPEGASLYQKVLIDHPESIDFRLFSKRCNPKLEHYDFRYETLLKAAGEK